MTREKAQKVLDLFLFEDVINNRNYHEDTHQITFYGNHFAVREYDTGIIHTFKIEYAPSDLPASTWIEEFEGQGWLNDED